MKCIVLSLFIKGFLPFVVQTGQLMSTRQACLFTSAISTYFINYVRLL